MNPLPTHIDRQIAALTTAAKKAPCKIKLKAKIKKLREMKTRLDWLGR
jgi:hypothetical protein